MNFFKNSQTNWKYISIVVILAIIVGGGILGYCWWIAKQEVPAEFPEMKKPEKVEGKAINWDKELSNKQLLDEIVAPLLNMGKQNIYVHSDIVSADIDNDGKEELVIFASRLNEWLASGNINYWLILLSKKESDVFSKDNYFLKAYFSSTDPYFLTIPTTYLKEYYLSKKYNLFINVRDVTGDKKLEIILSDREIPKETITQEDVKEEQRLTRFIIYKLYDDQLLPIIFKGGEFDSCFESYGYREVGYTSKCSYIQGAPTFIESEPRQLTIFSAICRPVSPYVPYAPLVSNTYIWDNTGFFKFLNTTALEAEEPYRTIIDYVKLNIEEITKASAVLGGIMSASPPLLFYPGNKIIVGFTDGHILGCFLGEYEIKNNKVYVTNIDESPDSCEKLEEKYNLPKEKVTIYCFSQFGHYRLLKSSSP